MDDTIGRHPNDASLYAKRAELHALQENWTQAAEDLDEALELAPDRIELMHRLADARLQLGDAEAALRLTDAALTRRPDEPRALLVRARARRALGHYEEAAADLSRLVDLDGAPSPALVRERAEVLERSGDRDAAAAALRDGIAQLGPLVTLVEPAVDLELRRSRPEAVLALLDRLDEHLVSAPRWQYRRGELLERTGRGAEAERAYRKALAGLNALPASRRDTPRHVALRDRIDERLERVAAAPSPPPSPSGPWALWPALMAMLAGALLGYRRRRGASRRRQAA